MFIDKIIVLKCCQGKFCVLNRWQCQAMNLIRSSICFFLYACGFICYGIIYAYKLKPLNFGVNNLRQLVFVFRDFLFYIVRCHRRYAAMNIKSVFFPSVYVKRLRDREEEWGCFPTLIWWQHCNGFCVLYSIFSERCISKQ